VQTQITKAMIHVYGHASAEPEQVAESFGALYTQEAHSESDLAIFAINPSAGVDQETIALWEALDEFQIPRLVVVTHLEKQEADFDDAVMIANRVFSPMATPFLVLHDEAGLPIALISLEDLCFPDNWHEVSIPAPTRNHMLMDMCRNACSRNRTLIHS
jgi:hypothetical protein